eukprot:m.83050 g.83050  ORF g.83050 m.83050 type:complete len:513 (+) comp8683_c0_seq1:42-1580(+)
MPKVTKEGYMWKQGGFMKAWKRRYLIQSEGRLSYYQSKDAYPPKGHILLDDIVNLIGGREKCLKNKPEWKYNVPSWPNLSKESYPLAIETSGRTYFFMFPTVTIGVDWHRSIAAAAKHVLDLEEDQVDDGVIKRSRTAFSRKQTSSSFQRDIQFIENIFHEHGIEEEAREEVYDFVLASCFSCFSGGLRATLEDTVQPVKDADMLQNFVDEYCKIEKELGSCPSMRILFHELKDIDDALQTNEEMGLPSFFGDGYYFYTDAATVALHNKGGSTVHANLLATLVIVGQTGVRETLECEGSGLMLDAVDLSEPQHSNPPVACLSAINERLSQVVVYKKSQCLPIAKVSFSIPHSSLPMLPYKERDLSNVPCMWSDVEGCVFIDEEAQLQKGSFPQSRAAMRIFKRQVSGYRRRKSVSVSGFSRLLEQAKAAHSQLGEQLARLETGAKPPSSSFIPALDAIIASINSCVFSIKKELDDTGNTDLSIISEGEELTGFNIGVENEASDDSVFGFSET